MRYLQVTYRQGKPLAAYLYLDRRPDDTAARTQQHGTWLLDYAADGRTIGVEFTSVGPVDLAELNRLLAAADQPALSVLDVRPLEAA
ncbi:MAG TPA: hypothetical protein VGR35_19415 [Tepidisphaeraceae bacterium]|nr:hypothetical protein [Tepidisphaeraceae bacterium]